MEQRIKSLYIITIIAILSFLAMQFYWLRGRYEVALGEYEQELTGRITECVDQYRAIRNKAVAASTDSPSCADEITVPRFLLSQQFGDSVTTTRIARLYTYRLEKSELSDILENSESSETFLNSLTFEPLDSAVYDASGATDDDTAWAALRNVYIERKSPFTTEGIDSILSRADIRARTTLDHATGMVWETTVSPGSSFLCPLLSVTIPYSQLEGHTVTITATISPFRVLPGMMQALIVSAVVSVLLIVCLLLQFSTVLKLSRLDKMRTGFITTMIHELKRPISTLKMCVSGLDNERMMQDDALRRELLAETRSALDNLSAYFSRLRDITFNSVEQIPLNLSTINLRSLFGTVAAAALIPAGKNVELRNGIDSSIQLSADRTHLCNILSNLLENAIKYSGSSVTITASATQANGSVTLSIADNGIGISPWELPHIFERFYRGKAAATELPGMGLGLAYVRLLTEAHGGTVAVDSSPGKGTRFTITLPQ